MRIWLVFASVLFSAPAYSLPNITIMADSSASLAVSKLARDYARISHVGVSTSFADKAEQSLQIHEGGSADVLITSDTEWLDNLQGQGLIDVYSKVEFAHGRLALVGPSDSTLSMKLTDNFMVAPLVHAMGDEPAFFVGNPEYIAEGKYAKEALRSIGALDVLEPYTLYLRSNEEMIQQVTQHHAYGVMMYGNALLLENAKIIDVFPETAHEPIHYYAVVLAGDNMEEARKFMRFLTTKNARRTITTAGLSVTN